MKRNPRLRLRFLRRFHHLTHYLAHHLPRPQLIGLLAIIVGLLTGLMGLVLKRLVYGIESWISTDWLPSSQGLPWWQRLLEYLPILTGPAVGILLTILLVRWVVKDDLSHGLSKVLKAIAVGNGRLPSHSGWSYVAACSLTAGFGGSVGMEAPIVAAGSGIGSNVARIFQLGYRHRVILIGCGAAAGVAAVFKAPIAGLILAFEVLAIEISAGAILPLLLAAASAAVLSMGLTDKASEFYFAVSDEFFFTTIPWYVVLGVLSGLVSMAFTRISWAIEDLVRPWSALKRYLIGAGLVCLLVFLFPPLFGEGFAPMHALLSGNPEALAANVLYERWIDLYQAPWLFLAFLSVVLIIKLFVTPLTTAAGGVGGIFAPSLFLGCFLGWAFALLVNLSGLPDWFGMRQLSTQNMALVGMAGVLAGVMHAPLTAIFLIAEITGGYHLFIPLIITAAISNYTIRNYEKHSVYTRKLASSGQLITTERDRSALGLLQLSDFIRNDAPSIPPHARVDEIISCVRDNTSEFLVVADRRGFCGFIFVDNIRPVLFVPESHSLVCAQDLIQGASLHLSPDASIAQVLNIFHQLAESERESTQGSDARQYLPVLDAEHRYLGYVRHSDILEAYRRKMVEISGDGEAL